MRTPPRHSRLAADGGGARRSTALTVALMLAVSVIFVGPTLANSGLATLTGSNFEIDNDANLVVDHDGLDWATSDLDAQVQLDQSSGQTDNSLKGSEDTHCPEPSSGSIQNNKSDLKEFGIYIEPHASDPTHPGFLNLFWTRVQEPTGTTNITAEFNQSDTMCTYQKGKNTLTGVTPERMAGDLLVTYDIDQGGAAAKVAVRRWTGTVWGGELVLSAAGQAVGTINNSAIPGEVTVDGKALGPYGPRTFGEAQLDLDVVFDPNSCESFGTAYLKSRSSSAFNSSLSDFIAPQSVPLSNCGSLTIEKVTDPTGLDDVFSFTATGPQNFDEDIDLADGEGETYNDVLAGEYTITEADAGPEFELTDITCTGTDEENIDADVATGTVTVGLAADENVTCTFTNTRKPGSILVLKLDENGNLLADAKFVIDPANLNNVTVIPPRAAGVFCIDDVALGDYTVTEEIAPPGYTASGPRDVLVSAPSTCDERLDGLLTPVDLAELKLEADAEIDNLPQSGRIEIAKVDDADNALEGVKFELLADDGDGKPTGDALDSCVTDIDGECAIENVDPGDYCVVEDASSLPPGYTADTDPQCFPVGIVEGGDLVELTFVNPRELGRIDIRKVDDADNELEGVKFELFADDGDSNPDGDALDSCATGSDGECTIEGVEPGSYCMVEVAGTVPAGYTADSDPQCFEVEVAGGGDLIELTFVNPRLHKVIVIVCHEGTNTLHSSTVTDGGGTEVTTLGASSMEAELCGLGGFTGKPHGSADYTVEIADH